jgi:hypothetical protein
MHRSSVLPIAMLATLAVASCSASGGEGAFASSTAAQSSSATSASPTPSPTQPALPGTPQPRRGAPSATCANGWRTPPEDSPDATDPLGIIRRTTGAEAPFEVVDMRMFIGPESPPSVGESAKGYLQDIVRWYIKLYTPDDLSFQGRFLVESRRFGRGLSAVAPYDTRGFRSPDWRGFQYDSSDTEPRAVPGLPGEWSGVEYDFVNGGEGLDLPGLPASLVGCLEAS